MTTLTTTVELVPFSVPTDVGIKRPPLPRQAGFQPLPRMNLNELDYATLNALCNEFRAEVFKRAGIADAPPVVCSQTYAVSPSQWDDRTEQR